MHTDLRSAVDDQINSHCQDLADTGRQRCTSNAHLGKRADAENQHRVQNDVAHRACHQAHHRDPHAAHRLEDLFKRQCRHNDRREHKRNARVGHSHLDNRFIAGEHPQKGRHDQNADHGDDHAVQQRKHQAVRCSHIGLFMFACAKVQRDLRIDAHAKADGNCVDQVLYRVHQRQGCHSILADLGHKQAVHNIVHCIDQHRDDHGQRHTGQQGKDRLFFHKRIVHSCVPPRHSKKPHNGPAFQPNHCVAKNSIDYCKNPHLF